MISSKIIDTNVPLTSVTTDHLVPLSCRLLCVRLIGMILKGDVVVVIDDQHEVLNEYRHNMYPNPNPSAGLASQFLMYLLNHQFDSTRVYRAKLSKSEFGNYTTYPSDRELIDFDPSDKKWIAISMSYKRETDQDVPIVNATDSDWLHFEPTFNRLGIQIEFLCKDILKAKEI